MWRTPWWRMGNGDVKWKTKLVHGHRGITTLAITVTFPSHIFAPVSLPWSAGDALTVVSSTVVLLGRGKTSKQNLRLQTQNGKATVTVQRAIFGDSGNLRTAPEISLTSPHLYSGGWSHCMVYELTVCCKEIKSTRVLVLDVLQTVGPAFCALKRCKIPVKHLLVELWCKKGLLWAVHDSIPPL